MYTRKLQKVGHSTLVVSVPKAWAENVGVGKGDTVTIDTESDGILKVFPGFGRKTKDLAYSCVIDADSCDDDQLLSRVITGNYIKGCDSTEIRARDELNPGQLKEVRDTVQRLVGIGIVEQEQGRMTVQNFVQPARFPVAGLLARLADLVSEMLKLASSTLSERRPQYVSQVRLMEEEVDRIYCLVARQLLIGVRDRSVGERIGLPSIAHAVNLRLVAKFLEEIADSAQSITSEAAELVKEWKVSQAPALSKLQKMHKSVRSQLSKSIEAFLSKDLKLANKIIDAGKQSLGEVETTSVEILEDVRGTTALAMRSILWHQRQILRYSIIIAETAINSALEEDNAVCHPTNPETR